MSSNSWLIMIQEAGKTCIIQDGARKVHYKFRDGREMVEEYNMDTNVVNKRAWKVCQKFGSQPKWEVEVGDPDPIFNEELDNVGIKETSTAPFVTKKLTKTAIEWRIRNLPYPIDNYNVTADVGESCLVVKTTNKKYFKKLPVIDLQRIGIQLDQSKIQLSHKFNTLIITYQKPPELKLCEKLVFEEINKIKCAKEGDVQCPQS